MDKPADFMSADIPAVGAEPVRLMFQKGEQPRFVQTVDAMVQALGDPDEQGMVEVEGQAAVYGNWFQIVETDTFSIQRRNNAGMFARALSQNPDIALRVNHETALARTQAGTLKVWETDQALMFRGQVNTNTQAGNDIIQNMKDGLVTQGSVMYWPLDMSQWSENKEGRVIEYQDIKEGKLDKGDVSLVIWGANPQCSTTLAQMIQMATTLTPSMLPDPAASEAAVVEERVLAQGRERARLSWKHKLADDPVNHPLVAERNLAARPQPPLPGAGQTAEAQSDTEQKGEDDE